MSEAMEAAEQIADVIRPRPAAWTMRTGWLSLRA